MKKIVVLLLLAAVCTFASSYAVSASTSADTIDVIRAQYVSINKNVARYKKVKKELSGYSAEGGEMDAYLDNKSVMKIVAHFYGEMGRADEDYYFWDGQLIFVFRRESTYDRPLSGKIISTKENRFYFNKGHMIRWIGENGRPVSDGKSSFKEKQDEYLANARKFTEVARS